MVALVDVPDSITSLPQGTEEKLSNLLDQTGSFTMKRNTKLLVASHDFQNVRFSSKHLLLCTYKASSTSIQLILKTEIFFPFSKIQSSVFKFSPVHKKTLKQWNYSSVPYGKKLYSGDRVRKPAFLVAR